MGQNCEKFISMCLESVKEADAIVYCDGGSVDNTLYTCKQFNVQHIIHQPYNQEDKQMNGKQRNFYLDYLKQHYLNDWALCIDADEVVDDLSKIKEFIQTAKEGVYSVHMRHFHNDIGHEDATQEKHFVPNRLFKVKDKLYYPEVEHPVLSGDIEIYLDKTESTTIWHLAHINHCFNIKNRYEKNIKHSNMHSKEFLDWWLKAHIFGQYPNKPINLTDIPEVILNNFHINKDELYFKDRTIDMKHPIMVKQWYDYFKPENVLDLGCGRGCYLYFWKWFCNDSRGFELSQWAVDHAFTSDIKQGDITKCWCTDKEYDLVTAIDVLEHLDNEGLDNCLNEMSIHGRRFLFSIPFIGDPNLMNDKTHKQFKTKEEWIKLIESHGIKIKDTPTDWLFAHQLLVGEK